MASSKLRRVAYCLSIFVVFIVTVQVATADQADAEFNLEVFALRPRSSATVLATAKPLADWLGAQLKQTDDLLIFSRDEKILQLKREELTARNGDILVPLRKVASALGFAVVYAKPAQTPRNQPFGRRAGVFLSAYPQMLWVPIFGPDEKLPGSGVLKEMLLEMDKVLPGNNGKEWQLISRFGAYAAAKSLKQNERRVFLLRLQDESWSVVAKGEDGSKVSRKYVTQLMEKASAKNWQEAIRFLSSDPPTALRIVADIRQDTVLSAVESLHQLGYFQNFGSVLRYDTAADDRDKKQIQDEIAFHTWFLNDYRNNASPRATAYIFFQKGLAHWATGDLERARKALREIAQELPDVVKGYGPNGEITYKRAMHNHYWVTKTETTPVYRYDYDFANPPPTLHEKVRIEPARTLLVAYNWSNLDPPIRSTDRSKSFFRNYLKLWEGSYVVPQKNCVSLAAFVADSKRDSICK